MNRCPRIANPEVYSAMAAAMVASAETALSVVGGPSFRTAIVDGATYRLIALGITDQHLLVLLCERAVPADGIVSKVQTAAAEVTKLLAR